MPTLDKINILRVTHRAGHGLYLDGRELGEILLHHSEQTLPLEVGDDAVVFINADPDTGRIQATTRIEDHVTTEPPEYKLGEPVELIVTRETPLGFVALIEHQHLGLLYHSSLRERIQPGQMLTGYIAAIRPDGKIDLTLDSSGFHRVTSLTDEILDTLKTNGGRIDLDDSSPSDDIRAAFGASKKAFKQAVGALYKQRRIRLLKPGIELIG